ncbi:unnamed protein product [Sphenostylis stenocarpa]|uniref:Uncharacterized protein n=1 Tax=Sphenostylis stenocarpa TaxID=92480 RepID=A0AA86VYI0_9FABA|nr:unnamed protein product [Sphenostylis stenocarpa]
MVYNRTERKTLHRKNWLCIPEVMGNFICISGKTMETFCKSGFCIHFHGSMYKACRMFWTGFRPSQRVKWARELKNEGARVVSSHTFIDPESTDLGFLKE